MDALRIQQALHARRADVALAWWKERHVAQRTAQRGGGLQHGSLAGTPSTGRTLPTRRSGVSPFLADPTFGALRVESPDIETLRTPARCLCAGVFLHFLPVAASVGRVIWRVRRNPTGSPKASPSGRDCPWVQSAHLASGSLLPSVRFAGGTALGWVAPSMRLRGPGRFPSRSRCRRRTGGSIASQRNRGIRQKFSPRARRIWPGGCAARQSLEA